MTNAYDPFRIPDYNPFRVSSRYGYRDDPVNWASSPAGVFGNFNAPPPQVVPNLGRRTDIPPDMTPTSAQVTPTVFPFLSADPMLGKYFNGGPNSIGAAPQFAQLPQADPNALPFSVSEVTSGGNVPERRLVGRVVNLSASITGAPPSSPDWPDATNGDGNWAATSAAQTTPDAQRASQPC